MDPYQGHNLASIQKSQNGAYTANEWVWLSRGARCAERARVRRSLRSTTVAPGMISNALERHQVASGGGSTTSQYYQYDHRGNVVAVTDSTGDIQYGYQYDAFGNSMFSFDEGAAAAPTDGIIFTGKDLDPDTGLYYSNARWYDPDVGRFISEARLRPDREHPYVFCANNPINAYDVSGHISQADFHDLCMAACLTAYVVACLIAAAGICLPCFLLPPPFGGACYLVCTAAATGICLGGEGYNDCTDFCCWLERYLNI